MSIGVCFFLLPNKLSSGGFSGIATILYYLLKYPMGTTTIILNIPLFIIAYIKLGKRFFIKAVCGTFFLSIFLNLLNNVQAITYDRLLSSIYGGILIGIGTSLILKNKASTGGSDLLSNIISKYNNNYKTGHLIVIIDIIIITLNVIIFKDIEIGLYSAVAIYLSGQMIDLIFEGTHFTKMVFIISDKYEEIANQISKQIRRGSTGIYAKGMYRNTDEMLLWCVASRKEVIKIKEIAKKIDKKSFVVIFNAREAFGLGFKKT